MAIDGVIKIKLPASTKSLISTYVFVQSESMLAMYVDAVTGCASMML